MERFSINISEQVLNDLQHRLANARWTDDFANDDWRYGCNTQYLKSLVTHWQERYDWRQRENCMNEYDHFRTVIDDIPIHFIHQRGKGPNPIPLILNHGWPWTFWDFHKIIGPLTDPVAYGGNVEDAFDVVVPSLPGFGFSTPLRKTGVNFSRTADLWVTLMEQLGYTRFASQGGDWGSFISAQLGHKYADRLIGVHLHTPSSLNFLTGKAFPREDFSAAEIPHLKRMQHFTANESGYMALQTTKPQTPAIALNDSPIGLLAWIVEKRRNWSDCEGDVETVFSKDELIDTVMLYWVTESFVTSARFYYEGRHQPWSPSHQRNPCVEAPTALAIFPRELTYPPRQWAEKYYNLQQWTDMPRGGHFAAMEQPEALVEDLRLFFRERRD